MAGRDDVMAHAAADRNLLFGILALQMDFISRDALVAAMNAWVLDKARPLGLILLDQGTLAAADHALLEAMVQRHLEKHGHDAERSLAAVPAPEAVRAELRRIVDNDLQASLAQLPATPSAVHDALAPTAPIAGDGARFQVLQLHASGGLGEVFVAKDSQLNREVALKEIQARHADHPESRARFVREAEITGGLEHPGIVPVYALGQHADGRPYYAMRFIRGRSLKQAIEHYHHPPPSPPPREQGAGDAGAQRNLELRQLLGRFIAVCNAIAYAHNRGVLHRDLKPSNIMLGEFGETLVVDWGLAKVLAAREPEAGSDGSTGPWPLPRSSSDSDLTHTGQALGTPAYMSPEQAAGRLDQVGPASDIYSLGATLYHLLTGQAPFAKSAVGEVLKQVQQGDFPPPRGVNHQLPAALEAICLRAMALEPQGRYASAKALADDLEHWLADEAVTAHAEPWPARLGRWARHHKGLVGSGAAIIAVGLTVVIAGWLVKEARDREATEQGLRGLAEDKQAEAESQRIEAERQKGEANIQRSEAETQRKRADRYLYFSRIELAHRAWEAAHIAPMDKVLEQTQPEYTGGEDCRGFERDYLVRLQHASLLTLQGHTLPVHSVAFSPDGRRIASACDDISVAVWDARTGRLNLTFREHHSAVHSVAFSPDSQRIASASYDGTVKIWKAETSEECLTLQGPTSPVYRVVFSPDGQHLASACEDGMVRIWNVKTGQESLTFKAHGSTVYSVAFSPDSQRLVSASEDQMVKVWDVRTGQERLILKGHSRPVYGVAFSPDGLRLGSASVDRTVKVWDARTGQETLTLRGHTSTVYDVTFSPDGQRLASASADQTVKVWDVRTGEMSHTLRGHRSPVLSVALSPDGQRLASASDDGMVKVWDARTDPESFTLKGHTSPVLSMAFSPDGQRLALASDDGTVRVWNAQTGQERLTLKGHAGPVTSVAFSPDGERLASASVDGTVKVWDARTGQETLTLKGHSRPVWKVVFSPDGQRLASTSEDGTIKVWDAHTGQERLTLNGSIPPNPAVAFSPNGECLASVDTDFTMKVWDVRTGEERLSLGRDIDLVVGVAFSPDGQRLTSVGAMRTVKVWDVRTGEERLTLEEDPTQVRSVAFSPDGQRFASGGGDRTVKVWDARTGQETLTLKGHTNAVTSVAFSPDGQRLASASIDQTVKVWDATPVNEASNLQRQAMSYFRFVAETLVLKDEMIRQIRQTPTLSEPARELALGWVKDYREIPARLNDASWSVVRGSWARPGIFPLALRQAEAACRQEPDNGGNLNTLGAAQYRNAQYTAALKTLTQSDKLNAARLKHSLPADLAFLAMTQFQLGQKAEAAATLGRLRDVMKKLPFDREAEELLKEAESLVDPKK